MPGDEGHYRQLSLMESGALDALDYSSSGKCAYRGSDYKAAQVFFLPSPSKGYPHTTMLTSYLQTSEESLTKAVAETAEFKRQSAGISGIPPLAISEPTLLNNLLNSWFVIIAVFGLFIGAYLIIRNCRKNTHTIFIGIFIITLSLVLFELTLFWWPGLFYQPKIPFFKVLIFLWAPSFYLYIKNKLTLTTKPTAKEIILHFSVFVITVLYMLLLNNTMDEAVYAQEGLVHFTTELVRNIWIKSIYFGAYFMLIVALYLRNGKTLPKEDRNWSKALIAFFGLLLVLTIFRAEFSHFHIYDDATRYIGAYALAGFISLFGLLLFLHPQLITKPLVPIEIIAETDTKYRNSGLTPDMSEMLRKELLEAMVVKRLFLDGTLTLTTLADFLNTDRYSLSQVINQNFGKNFYEFINDFRIAESVKLIEDNEGIELVEDLIYESGFNNRVSFYRAFKKRKQLTPSEYIQQNKRAS